MKINKLSLFVLVLLLGLTVVSAADVVDESTVSVEVPQVEQTNEIQNEVAQQDVQEDIYIYMDETSNDLSITEDVVITSDNVNSYTNKNWTVESDVTVTGTDGVTLNDVAINVAGNHVTLTETSTTSTTYDITLDENSASNGVNNNELYVYNTNGVTYYGNGAVNNLNILNTVDNNIPYIVPVQSNIGNKNLKKDESNPLIINIDNFSDYGVIESSFGFTITLNNPNDII